MPEDLQEPKKEEEKSKESQGFFLTSVFNFFKKVLSFLWKAKIWVGLGIVLLIGAYFLLSFLGLFGTKKPKGKLKVKKAPTLIEKIPKKISAYIEEAKKKQRKKEKDALFQLKKQLNAKAKMLTLKKEKLIVRKLNLKERKHIGKRRNKS
jgi:uncharacterized membrane protein YgaE (UPF0421/DUF939 family)